MLDTALTVLLLTLILATAFFLIPEGGRWLSARNRQRYRRLSERLALLAEEMRLLAEQLRPYRELQSPAYRRYYAAARGHMQTAEVNYRALRALLPRLSLPEVKGGLWAFPHFLDHPRHLAAIPRDTRLLQQIEQRIPLVRRELARSREILESLDHVADKLAVDSRHLHGEWLPHLATLLQAERDAGLNSLDDLEGRLDALQRQAAALEERLDPEGDPSLLATDALARQLQGVRAAARELESDISQVATARATLDEEIATLQAALLQPTESPTEPVEVPVDAPTQPPTEPTESPTEPVKVPVEAPAPTSPLRQQATAHLEAARTARARLAFTQARGQLHTVRALLDVATALDRAAAAITQATATAGAGDHVRRLPGRLETLHEEKQILLRRARENGTAQPLGELLLADLAGLAERATHLEQSATIAAERWQTALGRAQGQAASAQQALNLAVAQLEAVYPLPPGEPLLAQVREVEAAIAEAQEQPDRLRELAEEVAGLAGEWQRLAEALAEGVAALVLYRQEAGELIDEAHAAADGWKPLHPLLSGMERAAMTLWQVEPQGTVAQVLDSLDEAYTAYTALMDHYDQLVDAYEILIGLEEKLDAAYLAAQQQLPQDDLHLLARPANAHADAARTAPTVQEAQAHLQQALELLQEGGPEQDTG